MKLNTKTIAGLKLPDGKVDVIHFDDGMPGFGFRLRRASGDRVLRSWVCQYRNSEGDTRRKLIGSAETLSAEQAKAEAKKVLAEVALGGDPQAAKAAHRQKNVQQSLRAVVGDYLAAKKPLVRARTFAENVRYLTGPHFKPLHAMPVDQITRRDVAGRLTKITAENGAVTATRARSALSAFFAWALGNGLAESNPVIGTFLPSPAKPRERVLHDSELRAIWLASGDDDYGAIIKLLTLTGARRGEVGGMMWSELEGHKWSFPADRTKNKRAHTLPLPPLALSILEKVPRRVDRDHLFGSRSPDGFNRWDVKKGLDKRLSGVGPWTLHDLRRTCATRMADLGVQPHIIEAVLNHYSGHRAGVAGVYNRSPYEREVRAALALWADHIRTLVEGGERRVVAFERPAV
jgi:integrase